MTTTEDMAMMTDRPTNSKMTNSEDYVSYPVALALKKAGFDEPCDRYYTPEIWQVGSIEYPMLLWEQSAVNSNDIIYDGERFSAPTLWQAQKWLREKHNIHIQIEVVVGKRWTYTLVDMSPKTDMYGNIQDRIPEREGYPVEETYESALAAGIEAAAKLI